MSKSTGVPYNQEEEMPDGFNDPDNDGETVGNQILSQSEINRLLEEVSRRRVDLPADTEFELDVSDPDIVEVKPDALYFVDGELVRCFFCENGRMNDVGDCDECGIPNSFLTNDYFDPAMDWLEVTTDKTPESLLQYLYDNHSVEPDEFDLDSARRLFAALLEDEEDQEAPEEVQLHTVNILASQPVESVPMLPPEAIELATDAARVLQNDEQHECTICGERFDKKKTSCPNCDEPAPGLSDPDAGNAIDLAVDNEPAPIIARSRRTAARTREVSRVADSAPDPKEKKPDPKEDEKKKEPEKPKEPTAVVNMCIGELVVNDPTSKDRYWVVDISISVTNAKDGEIGVTLNGKAIKTIPGLSGAFDLFLPAGGSSVFRLVATHTSGAQAKGHVTTKTVAAPGAGGFMRAVRKVEGFFERIIPVSDDE